MLLADTSRRVNSGVGRYLGVEMKVCVRLILLNGKTLTTNTQPLL
jgi:hypothetical protein